MKIAIKISTLIISFCFLIQNSYSQQNLSGWYWINGQPQTNDLKWVKVFDALHIYAVGSNGTFMKSSDGGDTWIINSQAGIPDSYFGAGNTLDLNSAYFFNANTGIVGGKNDFDVPGAYIKRTTNAGTNFTQINLGISEDFASLNNFYFLNSNTGYACGNASFKAIKTTNGGLNWSAVPNVPVESYNCVYAKDVNNIFLGSANSKIIFKTSNGGTTWTSDTLPSSFDFSVQDIKFANANTGYVAGNACYFGYTTNGGTSWNEAAFPNQEQGQYKLTLVGSTVYSLGSFQSYYYTSNLGATWDSVNFYDISNPYQQDPFYNYWMDINGNDIAVVGLGGTVNISNDGGSTWRNKNYCVGKNFDNFYDVFALSGNGKVWACGAGFGSAMLYSSNGGANWVEQNTGTFSTLFDVQMINASTGFSVGGNAFFGESVAIKTTDGGNTWNSVYNTFQQYNAVDFVNVNTGWIWGGLPFGGGTTLAKTTDGGNSWTEQPTTPPISNPIASGDMFDANTGWCVSGYSVFKTTNSGDNWNLVSMPNPDSYYDKVKMLSAANVILGGADKIYKTINGGISWDSVFLTNNVVTLFAMDWADQYNGIVTGTSGYTVKTTNGGLNWTLRNTGGSTVVSAQMTSKDTVFSCSDRNGPSQIFRLYDNNTSISLNLTVGIEGFWNGTFQVSDTVRCYLRSSSAPYAVVDSAIGYLGTSGFASFIFNNANSGSYYLEIKHRNALETWSAAPVAVLRRGNYNYEFISSSSKAYGNNTVLVSERYCNYSGDINQDGIIDLTDLSLTDNDVINFVKGYIVTDVNGDGIADLTDMGIVDNNSFYVVVVSRP